ncbi:ATPase SWSAP1 isoform X2 [Nerophis lumbriciformis]|uniref:ATPase SWSAP1 isoform X2 n=1 Tax=Nerophis lumbriciformis TaxID=546530 RepID=UPI002ADF3F56|nr:uncharacterized protein LOC133615230 isoform X2 [Nerophis lumbriciformis]
MADVLTHMFANLSQADSKKDVVTPAPPECGVLIVGEQSLGRSLLLLTAVTAASQVGMKVVFFAPQQIQSLPASLQKCAPSLSPESLKKITFCYPRTAEELCRQIAGLHESSSTFPPSLIIVDRLEDYPCDGHSGRHPASWSGRRQAPPPAASSPPISRKRTARTRIPSSMPSTATFSCGVLWTKIEATKPQTPGGRRRGVFTFPEPASRVSLGPKTLRSGPV